MHYNDWKDAEEENVEEHGSGGRDKAYVMFYELELEDGVEIKYAYARQSEKEGPVTVEMKESSPYAVGQIYGHEVESVEGGEQKFVYEIRGDHERVQIEATTAKATRKLSAEEFWDMHMQKQMFGQVLSKRTSEMNPNEIMGEVMDGAHERLDLYSMTPFVGGLSDLLNIALYAQEEDYGNAGICAAGVGISFIPGGKIATKIGQLAKAGIKRIGRVTSLGAMNGGKVIDNAEDLMQLTKNKHMTIIGENMPNRIEPFSKNAEARTIPFGTTDEGWSKLTPQQQYKMNDGSIRKRIKEGDEFIYIGRDVKDPVRPAQREAFDLTGSELLRLEERGVKCHETTLKLSEKIIKNQ